MKKPYTKKDLEEFDQIVSMLDSQNQMDRIQGRIDLPKFEQKFTEKIMKQMWKVIKEW